MKNSDRKILKNLPQKVRNPTMWNCYSATIPSQLIDRHPRLVNNRTRLSEIRLFPSYWQLNHILKSESILWFYFTAQFHRVRYNLYRVFFKYFQIWKFQILDWNFQILIFYLHGVFFVWCWMHFAWFVFFWDKANKYFY